MRLTARENDRDELAAVTSGTRHHVKAGFTNEAGLYAVAAGKADKEAVMGAHDLLAHLHSDRREEFGVLRKLDDNGAWELSQIAGMMLGMVCEIVLLATS